MSKVDIKIKGATILDGRGGAPFEGDVAINSGRITEIGRIAAGGREEIDARGYLVTPGWVDIHTHYDGQATWDHRIQPSSIQGTTTVVMGNCGVGFAPVRPADHDMLIRLMEGVEDIPGTALHAGLRWNWQSFPEYLDALEGLPRDIDVAAQVPHSALRVFVMGERGAQRAPATPLEIAEMGRLTCEAIREGALGFSTSRVVFHRSIDGALAPSVGAAYDELLGIADAMAPARAGVLQLAADYYEGDEEFQFFMDMARRSGRPLTFSFVDVDDRPDFWDLTVRKLADAKSAGLSVRAQVQGRPVGLLLCLEGSVHPFITKPSYMAIADKPVAERAAIMRDPAFRARVLAETAGPGHPFVEQAAGAYHKMFDLGDPPQYEPSAQDSLAARAARLNADPQGLAYDILTAGDGMGYLYFPMANFRGGNLDTLEPLLRHPQTLQGLSDGGAHVGVICDASASTYMLSYWCRDRIRGPKLDLPTVVMRQTKATAEAVGLFDRGVLGPGYRADLNVIDFDRLQLRPPRMVHDLPAAGRRLMQDAEGYVTTVVNGEVIYREGKSTRALPGRLVRGGQPAPRA
jgi:N-acyl-D-aspartate/D-glutamate deacylase